MSFRERMWIPFAKRCSPHIHFALPSLTAPGISNYLPVLLGGDIGWNHVTVCGFPFSPCSMLGLIRGRQKRQSDPGQCTVPSQQRVPAADGGSLPSTPPQMKAPRRVRISLPTSPEKERPSKVPERPSLIASQRAAMAAEAAAAEELKPPEDPEKKVCVPPRTLQTASGELAVTAAHGFSSS